MARTATASRRAKRSASSASRHAPWRHSASRRRSAASGVSASTATATTAIDSAPQYIGRFAPSPTGPLHLGSLVAALGSYADARSRGGRWLLRMEDLDRAREVKGAADHILQILELFGFSWDGRIEYQSRRTAHYLHALETLRACGVTFQCSCSRREHDRESGYPGT